MTLDFIAEQIDRATSEAALEEAARAFWGLLTRNGISETDARCSELAAAIEAKRTQLRQPEIREAQAAKTLPALTEPASTAVPMPAEESENTAPLTAGKKHTSKGGFFAIDLGAFRCAAAGGLNPAICHLVMARGTGRDNRKTQWSVHAIEQRTGMSRPNAKKAVQDLLDRGIWKKTRGGKHPRYTAVPGDKIPGLPFSPEEQAAIAAIRNDGSVSAETEQVGAMLVARGLARWLTHPNIELDNTALAALKEPKLIWLPNTLIDGAADETPPIELLRQTRSLPALRLLIELYAVQFLPHFDGVPRTLLQGKFQREKLGEFKQFVIWGFRPGGTQAESEIAQNFFTGKTVKTGVGRELDEGWDGAFWPALETLVQLGLVQRVGMLLDGDDADAEIIHPCPVGTGESDEQELAEIAMQAAIQMLPPTARPRVRMQGQLAIPVPMHIANATMAEVFRLRYRPHTSITTDWYARMKRKTRKYINQYRKLMPADHKPEPQSPAAISRQNQRLLNTRLTPLQSNTNGIINGGSTADAFVRPKTGPGGRPA